MGQMWRWEAEGWGLAWPGLGQAAITCSMLGALSVPVATRMKAKLLVNYYRTELRLRSIPQSCTFACRFYVDDIILLCIMI